MLWVIYFADNSQIAQFPPHHPPPQQLETLNDSVSSLLLCFFTLYVSLRKGQWRSQLWET